MAKKAVEKPYSYCNERLELYGFDKHNKTQTYNMLYDGPKPEHWNPKKDDLWFSEDANKNIKILYKTLTNSVLTYHETSGKAHPFFRTCLNPINRQHAEATNGKKQKYSQPKDSGKQVFLTQHVIDTYCYGTEVDTLYLIEGEFKAFSLWMHCVENDNPLAVVGIPGIHMFTDESKTTPYLNPMLHDYIIKCKVSKVVMIHDADCLDIGSWDYEREPNKDLSKRLRDFYGAVANMREIINNVYQEQEVEFYYSHIKEDFLTEPCTPINGFCKGLDDLFLARKGKEIDIIEDLQKLSKSKLYFSGFNATEKKPDFIQKYFLLKKTSKVPSDFYGKFNQIIGDKVFNFQGWRYQYIYNEDAQSQTLQTVQHNESHKYIRVGIKYLKILYKPNSKGIEERKLEPWSKEILKQDFVDKGYLRFFDEIKKYSDFCNIPEHDPEKFSLEYKNQYGDIFFNLYYPLTHQLQPGNWQTIKDYLTHVFSDDFLTFALDYLFISYTMPTQRLPIICLVSKEHNTGKSTFLWLLREMFMENTTVIGNQELHDNFNDDYVTKKFICIDEGLIEKVAILERIKSWNTSHKIKMNTKNVSRTEIDFFANIVMTSNHEDNFARIDPNADRFAVFKVPQLHKRDPDILEKMTAEIPHFLHYLKHTHKLTHTKKERFYFSVEDYATDALRAVQRESKSWLQKTLEIMFQTIFTELNSTEDIKVDELNYTESEIHQEVSSRYKKTPEIGYLRRVLKDELKLQQKHIRGTGYKYSNDDKGYSHVSRHEKTKGRYYIIKITDMLDLETIQELGITEQLLNLNKQQTIDGPF